MNRISRRTLLSGGGAAAGSAFFIGRSTAQSKKPSAPITLEAKFVNKPLAGVQTKLRSFNGQVPGPMIKTFPGDTLRIRINNTLPHVSHEGWNHNHNVPHMFNTTNLHLHGLDIAPHLFSPLGTTNPTAQMIAIDPGKQFEYTFVLPEDHPPGLYWYHPHHHGSTAVQAVSGMAGGLIVYGDIDEVPEIKAARDIPLVIQDIGLFPDEKVSDLWTYEPVQNAMWDTITGTVWMYDPLLKKNVTKKHLKGGFTAGDYKLRLFLLNGQPFFKETHNFEAGKGTMPVPAQLPVQRITVAPGEVVRFRLLNACSDNLMPIVVEGHDVHLLGMDGVNFDTPRTIPSQQISAGTWDDGQLLMAPANRAEFLIKASPKAGVYRIVQLAQSRQFLMSEQKTIAEIVVEGAPKTMRLPSKLPVQKRYYPTIQPDEIKRIRQFVFSGVFPPVVNPYVGLDFTVNNNSYDELACPSVVEKDTAEEWHISVLGAHHGGTEGHPFHIHVNHFEVISVGDTTYKTPLIQDTVWVPMKSTAVIRMKFKQFTGKSVLHCHILPHEDTGMMENFLIV